MITTEVIFDTETTGLMNPSSSELSAQAYIVDFFALKLEREGTDVRIVDSFGTFIKPPTPISEETTRITKIKQIDVENAPSFVSVWKKIAEFFQGTDRLVAHNAGFDVSMLANELLRIDKVLHFPWPIDHYCTVQNSMKIEQRRMSLTNLHIELLGEGFPDAHRAETDVRALFRVYKAGLEMGIFK
jgi:DNA polymerase III alpha subunit (gram-positive type)